MIETHRILASVITAFSVLVTFLSHVRNSDAMRAVYYAHFTGGKCWVYDNSNESGGKLGLNLVEFLA
jgi:hypothetical protein